MTLGHQIVFLLVLAIPLACVAWTVTHEEIFREARVVREQEQNVQETLSQKILLLVHLRILLQFLRHRIVAIHYAVPLAFRRLARIHDCRVRTRVGREYLYERIQPAATRYQT